MSSNVTIRIQASFERPYPAPIQALILYDALGKPVRHIEGMNTERVKLERENLPAGLYVLKVQDVFGSVYLGKLVIE